MSRLLFILAAFICVKMASCQPNVPAIIIHGQVFNDANQHLDATVRVMVKAPGITDTIYCDSTGSYSISLAGIPNHTTLVVSAMQDWSKIKTFSTGEPCPVDCPVDKEYLGNPKQKVYINTDSALTYSANFVLREIMKSMRFPSVYFRKNDTMTVRALWAFDPDPDSAICMMKNIMKCDKRFVVQVVGYCSPKEKSPDTLSASRAVAVGRRLLAMGINPKRLEFMAGGVWRDYDYDPVTQKEIAKPKNPPAEQLQCVMFRLFRRDFVE